MEVSKMPRYIALMKFTEQGVKDIKNAPQQLEEGVAAVEKMGGKMIDIYATMGEYDYVAISEWPDDDDAMAFIFMLASRGNVRTTTLKAWDQQQFSEIINNVP